MPDIATDRAPEAAGRVAPRRRCAAAPDGFDLGAPVGAIATRATAAAA